MRGGDPQNGRQRRAMFAAMAMRERMGSKSHTVKGKGRSSQQKPDYKRIKRVWALQQIRTRLKSIMDRYTTRRRLR
jgi:hypothetical protein